MYFFKGKERTHLNLTRPMRFTLLRHLTFLIDSPLLTLLTNWELIIVTIMIIMFVGEKRVCFGNVINFLLSSVCDCTVRGVIPCICRFGYFHSRLFCGCCCFVPLCWISFERILRMNLSLLDCSEEIEVLIKQRE